MNFETNTAKIIARLLREGWEDVGGNKHTKLRKAGFSNITIPRHREQSPGVARNIAKFAGWAKK